MTVSKITNAPTPNEQIDKINELVDNTNTNSSDINTINNTLSSKENTSNKVSSITNTTSTTLYPSNKAVVDYVAQATGSGGLPVGMIVPTYGPISDSKFIELNGQTVNPSSYPELNSYLTSNNLLLDDNFIMNYIDDKYFAIDENSIYDNMSPSTLEYDGQSGLLGFTYGNYYKAYSSTSLPSSSDKWYQVSQNHNQLRIRLEFTMNSLGVNSNTTSNAYSDYACIVGCDQYKGLLVRWVHASRKLNFYYTHGNGSKWELSNKNSNIALEYNKRYILEIHIYTAGTTTGHLQYSIVSVNDSFSEIDSGDFTFTASSIHSLYSLYFGCYSQDTSSGNGYASGLELHSLGIGFSLTGVLSIYLYDTLSGYNALDYILNKTGSNGWFYKRSSTQLIVPTLNDVVMYGNGGSIEGYKINKGSVPNIIGGMLNARCANSAPYHRSFGGIRIMGNASNFYSSGDSDRNQAMLNLRGGNSSYSYIKEGVHPNNFKVKYYIVAKS